MNLDIVILAAGQGSRMRSSLPKVLHPIGGKSMLSHVLDAGEQLQPKNVHVVYGHGGALVKEKFANTELLWAEQAEQLGTGHAVKMALPNVQNADAILVLYGDVPLVTASTMQALVNGLENAAVAVLSTQLDDATGYGRIVRIDGGFTAIVEHKDANDQQRDITEVNTGLMAIRADALALLNELDNDNAQQEYYLTDIVELAKTHGMNVTAVCTPNAEEVAGVNNRLQQAEAERVYQSRQAQTLLDAGVTILDPHRLDIRGNVQCGKDVVLDVNVMLEGEVELGDNVIIGANCVIKNTQIANGTQVKPFSHIDGAIIGEQADIGPFARLREGTKLGDKTKIGNFVETKKTQLASGSKINHLSYVGDATVGSDVNIGAGTITCNYDGANKHQTVIDDGAFIGSGTQLVAPVNIGKNATIGAGSTIRKDAPDDKLTLSKGRTSTIDGWQRPVKNK